MARARVGDGRRRYGLDLTECWRRAKARILEASGQSADVARAVIEPVARARRLAELAAPADMRLSLALGLGASPADLEQDKAGARLMLEAAHKRLGIVGLRSGDSLELGASERMTDFLRAWFDAATPGAVSPGSPHTTPSETIRGATWNRRLIPAPLPTPPPSGRVVEGTARALPAAPARPPAPGIETGPNLHAGDDAEGCPSP